MSQRDYYEILGLDKGASDDEIKKAFRRKAVELHPDKAGGDETKFKEVNEAYDVLKDSGKRQRYDQFGHAGVGGASGGGGGGNPFGGFSGFGGQSGSYDFGEDIGLGDIFNSFFGGGQRQNGTKTARGNDVETMIDLDFEQAIFGVEKDLKIKLVDTCEHCKGSTAEPGYELKTCGTCKGNGQVTKVMRTVFGNIQQAVVCGTCKGNGKVPEKACSVCKGSGTQRQNQTIKLKIPAGVDDGATIRLREHGEAVANGTKGDLYVNIRVKPHKRFTREGDLVLSEEHIGMADAALGTEIEVDTVDGPIKMKVPEGTQSGADFKLSEHGVPSLKTEQRGAHIVTIVVDTPVKLSKEQIKLLEDFKNSPKKGIFGL